MRLSAGLRLEETEINTSYNLKGFQYKRSYFNVFPSGSITYKKDENNGYHLAYNGQNMSNYPLFIYLIIHIIIQ